jgi:hypothetical protein
MTLRHAAVHMIASSIVSVERAQVMVSATMSTGRVMIQLK